MYGRRGIVKLRIPKLPWDLIVTLLYTAVASLTILSFREGAMWAVLLVLFAPGYAIVAALFPSRGLSARLRNLAEEGERLLEALGTLGVDRKRYRNDLAFARQAAASGQVTEAIAVLEEANERLRKQLAVRAGGAPGVSSEALRPLERPAGAAWGLDWTERSALSIGLSIAVVSLVGLLLNLTPSGIRLEPLVLVLLLVTVLAGLVALGRRIKLPIEDWPSPALKRNGTWGGLPRVDKGLTLVLAASIVFAGAVVVDIAITPRPLERFTQFFILDGEGGINQYPRNLAVSENGTVILVLVNNESVEAHYTIRIDLVGVEVVRNITGGFNETVERNRTGLASFEVTLPDRGTWQRPFTFNISASGLWRTEFLLFGDGDFSHWDHYPLVVELYVRVS